MVADDRPEPDRDAIGKRLLAEVTGERSAELSVAGRTAVGVGVAEADQRYSILNACRAVAHAAEDVQLSKIDGGAWWLENRSLSELVVAAISAQRAGVDLGPGGPGARAFVATAIARIEQARPS